MAVCTYDNPATMCRECWRDGENKEKRMKWFESKTRREVKELRDEIESLRAELCMQMEVRIKELRDEIESLRAELCMQMEVRIGEWPRYFCGGQDPRPAVQLKDVVLLLIERLNLKIKQTPEVSAMTVIERKPKTPNVQNQPRR